MSGATRRALDEVFGRALDNAKQKMRNARTDEDELYWARQVLRLEQERALTERTT